MPTTHNTGIALSLQLQIEKLFMQSNKTTNKYRQGHYWTENNLVVLKRLSEGNFIKLMFQLHHSAQKSLTALHRGPEFSDCQHELPQSS